jgi:hypothetical protein
VKGATVYAIPLGRIMAAVVHQSTSDESGSFIVANFDHGRYFVSVAKPDEGYPPLTCPFHTGPHARLTVLRLSAEHRSSSIILHLGKMAGILTGTVTDAATLGGAWEDRAEVRPLLMLSGGTARHRRARRNSRGTSPPSLSMFNRQQRCC